MWNSWVELVAKKINVKGEIKVIMPGGEEFIVPNDYSKKASKSDDDLPGKFRDKYIGKITGRDVSRQHYPKEMYENVIRGKVNYL